MINAAFDEPQVRATDVSFWSVDRETLEDRAIFATDGSLESDCAAYRRPDQGHRVSPWFRLPLKLHSVESARASYNTWAASEWDRNHDGPPTYVLGENGQKRELARPKTLMQQRL